MRCSCRREVAIRRATSLRFRSSAYSARTRRVASSYSAVRWRVVAGRRSGMRFAVVSAIECGRFQYWSKLARDRSLFPEWLHRYGVVAAPVSADRERQAASRLVGDEEDQQAVDRMERAEHRDVF